MEYGRGQEAVDWGQGRARNRVHWAEGPDGERMSTSMCASAGHRFRQHREGQTTHTTGAGRRANKSSQEYRRPNIRGLPAWLPPSRPPAQPPRPPTQRLTLPPAQHGRRAEADRPQIIKTNQC